MSEDGALNPTIQEFAAECLLIDGFEPRSVVALIVQEFPNATGLQVVYALVSTVEGLRVFKPMSDEAAALSGKVFEASAVLAADLYALEVSGVSSVTSADLISYWGTSERYFTLPISEGVEIASGAAMPRY